MVYEKVLEKITGVKQNGHAVANAKNKISLAAALSEIETMIKDGSKNCKSKDQVEYCKEIENTMVEKSE